ncbi:MAG: histidine kinase dimerization/phospho-acceptor domain-containing protein, partial [Pseudomonadota bacterium]
MTHSPDAGDFSDMLALLAHEVQGPLAGMAGLAQSLTNRDLPPAARDEVESLARTSAALISTVETMITAARLGESAPTVQPFSPRLLVRD